MYSTVFATKSASTVFIPDSASCIAFSMEDVVCTVPEAMTVSPRTRSPPWSESSSPSSTRSSKSSSPTSSTSGMPAAMMMPGPRFG